MVLDQTEKASKASHCEHVEMECFVWMSWVSMGMIFRSLYVHQVKRKNGGTGAFDLVSYNAVRGSILRSVALRRSPKNQGYTYLIPSSQLDGVWN